MSLLQTNSSHVVTAHNAGDLSAVCRPDRNLALWQRSIPVDVMRWIDRQPTSRLPDDRVMLSCPGSEAADIARLLHSHRLESSLQAQWILNDIISLVTLFRKLSGYTSLSLRLDAVCNDGCRKFHTDKVGLRLLCTYRGNGTQWLPETVVNRQALGILDNDDICLDTGKIQQLVRGDVGVFKGDAFGQGHIAGIVHRSAPGATPRKSRMVLCIDNSCNLSA